MTQKNSIICILLSSLLGMSSYAMEGAKIYKKELLDAEKALVVIETILKGSEGHLKIKPARGNLVKIQAKVNPKDVAIQEKQYTEEEFYPFLVHQEADKVTIKPYIKGTCTVYLPQGTLFSILGNSSPEIAASLLPYKKTE